MTDAFAVSLGALRAAADHVHDDAALVRRATAGLAQALHESASAAGEGPLTGALRELAVELDRRGRGLGDAVSAAGDALGDSAVIYGRAEGAVARGATGLMS